MSEHPRPFKPGPIEPVVYAGENVLLLDREAYNLYQVAYIEPIPASHPLVANIGAILAGATAAPFNTQNILDMQYGQFGQYRVRLLDDVHAVLSQPQSVARFSTKNVNARISVWSHLYDPDDHQTEFFIYEDDRIFLTATNPTGYNLAQARAAFYGYRYVLVGADGQAGSGGKVPPIDRYPTIKKAKESGFNFTVIPVGGWGR